MLKMVEIEKTTLCKYPIYSRPVMTDISLEDTNVVTSRVFGGINIKKSEINVRDVSLDFI